MPPSIALHDQKALIGHLFELEDQLVEVAAGFNLKLHRSPPSLYPHLENQTLEFIQRAHTHMTAQVSVFRHCKMESIDPWNDREFFRLSMQALGLSYPSDFFDSVSTGDLIEGYDMNRFQIFRNLRFMECSGYSLMQILTHDWTELYVRPRLAQEKMISYIDEILWTANRTIPFDVPLHYIRELMSPEKQTFEVFFKRITPLFRGPNQPYGLVGTCVVELVDKEKDGEKSNFAFV